MQRASCERLGILGTDTTGGAMYIYFLNIYHIYILYMTHILIYLSHIYIYVYISYIPKKEGSVN